MQGKIDPAQRARCIRELQMDREQNPMLAAGATGRQTEADRGRRQRFDFREPKMSDYEMARYAAYLLSKAGRHGGTLVPATAGGHPMTSAQSLTYRAVSRVVSAVQRRPARSARRRRRHERFPAFAG